jgi:hypothetical protein
MKLYLSRSRLALEQKWITYIRRWFEGCSKQTS